MLLHEMNFGTLIQMCLKKVFKVKPSVAYKQDAKYEDLVSFVITANQMLGNTLDSVDVKEEVLINGLDFSPAV